MARRRPATVHGVLAVDKGLGRTSRDVVNALMRLYGERRCGHAGTLDPNASGVLVVCFGDATAGARWLMTAPKRYLAAVRFGAETSTDDAAGEVTLRCPSPALRDPAIAARLREIVDASGHGYVWQRPPEVSALKRDGVRDHERVRRGERVARAARRVWQGAVTITSVEADGVRAVLDVGSGFYVRAWARDLGRAMDSAAHLVALRRLCAGGYGLDEAVTLDALAGLDDDGRRALLRPLPEALGAVLPTWRCEDDAVVLALAQGKRVLVDAGALAAVAAPRVAQVGGSDDGAVTDDGDDGDRRGADVCGHGNDRGRGDDHAVTSDGDSDGARDDGALLVCDSDGRAIAVVTRRDDVDAYDICGSAPDLRRHDGDGVWLRVQRGLMRPASGDPTAP